MRDYEELVKKLRDCRNMAVYSKFWWDITTEAADAIEELQQIVDKKERQIEYLFTLITEKDNEIDSINTCLDTYRALTEAMQGNQIPEWISKEEK